ncbi:RDD family protein [Georgenia wangjunii]|uniref:RDD family protein n=1 Tax=Georgenia wangjunii TaxID=3117730 RepID=UPI002F26C72C
MNERGLQTAGLGRRILALLVDWAIASAISAGFFDFHELATLGVFALMTWILISLTGATIGHTVLGLVVRGLGGRPGPGRAAIRTVALCLVIPAVVWGTDGRGLHDVWAGTVITRR